MVPRVQGAELILTLVFPSSGEIQGGPSQGAGGGVGEQLQEWHQSPLGSSRGLFARVGQGKVLSPPDKHRGTSAPVLRATGPDPVPDHKEQ